jgi:hypothetical protein
MGYHERQENIVEEEVEVKVMGKVSLDCEWRKNLVLLDNFNIQKSGPFLPYFLLSFTPSLLVYLISFVTFLL